MDKIMDSSNPEKVEAGDSGIHADEETRYRNA